MTRIMPEVPISGEYPYQDAISIDLNKASAEDRKILSKYKSPVDAIERQLQFLFARSGVAGKMEVRRDGNMLYICSTTW